MNIKELFFAQGHLLEGKEVQLNTKPHFKVLGSNVVRGTFIKIEQEYIYIKTDSIIVAIHIDLADTLSFVDFATNTLSIIDFADTTEYNIEYFDTQEEEDIEVQFEENISRYEDVLLSDDDFHTDSLFLFIQLKLERILIHRNSENFCAYYGCDFDTRDIEVAYEVVTDIVDLLSEGQVPGDADVAHLMTLLSKAHQWWD